MDEPDQNSLSSLSSLQLLEELESFIILEFKKNGNLWTCLDQFSNFFYEKYGVTPEEVARGQGESRNLRRFLIDSRRFSIYAQVPHQVYVALLETIVPGSSGSQSISTFYKVQQPWKMANNLLNSMKSEGDAEILHDQCGGLSKYQPVLVSEIKTIHDLEVALLEIIKKLTGDNPENSVSIGALSKAFSNSYKHPIRAMMRTVCPDLKLIDLLQSMIVLKVQKVDDGWQVSIGSQAID